MSSSPVALKKTPLNAKHRASGARMVEFGGWDMPVEYSGITDEHLAVRTRAGLFDVSHMGQIELAGADALAAVQWMTSNDASRLAIGQVQYSALTTDQGTFVDDVLVYRMADDHYLLVVNAGNIVKDHEWIVGQAKSRGGDVAVVNSSSRYALIALQGPAAQEILQTLTGVDLAAIKYYWFATGEVASVRATISRTGYTGEDGFEIFVAPAMAEKVWDAILAAGRQVDVRPAGLGARDTLRLEACMRLCGSDMDEHVSVLEAGLGWIVGWKKDDFMGAERLRAQKAGALERKLAAFEMRDRAIARHGHPVLRDGAPCGVVTSGTQTPFLKKAIGFAMVPVEVAVPGTPLTIEIRGRLVNAEVVPEPFYKRPKPSATGA
ncbi:MAG TPA: glycine cleavage system aminomethyltransferase GcvT [Vicinamibacterales bacterium]|nr:glycine cleavage system aminomethyltransferase GcvT [Vicinamibacterales bacterium]